MVVCQSAISLQSIELRSTAAFGIFARSLPQAPEFSKLHQAAAGLELADSITADAHKLLNVVRLAPMLQPLAQIN
jgi:glutamate/tyrosine decarboxylase-like PLP-dependent enzyme